jgi:hypothetical protein
MDGEAIAFLCRLRRSGLRRERPVSEWVNLSMPFDLSLLPLYRSQDEIRARAPGIVLFEPPRRAERVRSAERLLCYLTYQGDAAPDAETERLLQQLQATYYATAGSTTAALRTAALHLNRLLLDRNFALRSQKRQGFGLLVLMALRPEQAIWLQGGATHLFLWEQRNLRHVHDPASAGLGYAQSPSFRYGQLNFQTRATGLDLWLCSLLAGNRSPFRAPCRPSIAI